MTLNLWLSMTTIPAAMIMLFQILPILAAAASTYALIIQCGGRNNRKKKAKGNDKDNATMPPPCTQIKKMGPAIIEKNLKLATTDELVSDDPVKFEKERRLHFYLFECHETGSDIEIRDDHEGKPKAVPPGSATGARVPEEKKVNTNTCQKISVVG